MGSLFRLFGETAMKANEELTRTAIIYASASDTNHYELAQWVAEGAREAGAKVKILKVEQATIDANAEEATKSIPVATLEDLEWADAIIFCVSTQIGHVSEHMQSFLQITVGLSAEGKLANKAVSAVSIEQEVAILSLYPTIYEWGAIVVTPDQDGKMSADVQTVAKNRAKRTVKVAQALKHL